MTGLLRFSSASRLVSSVSDRTLLFSCGVVEKRPTYDGSKATPARSKQVLRMFRYTAAEFGFKPLRYNLAVSSSSSGRIVEQSDKLETTYPSRRSSSKKVSTVRLYCSFVFGDRLR